MRNWQAEVRRKFEKFEMPEEVLREIAGHLEELYETSRNEGTSEEDAIGYCNTELGDVAEVGGRILQIRGGISFMNSRVKRVWIPGAVAFAAAIALIELMPRLHWHTSIIVVHGMVFAMYIPWLMALPFCGAAGAYLSRRSGGRTVASILSGLFPAIVPLASFGLFAFTPIIVDHQMVLLHHPIGLFRMVRDWVMFPAIALLFGVIPVCILMRNSRENRASLA